MDAGDVVKSVVGASVDVGKGLIPGGGPLGGLVDVVVLRIDTLEGSQHAFCLTRADAHVLAQSLVAAAQSVALPG